MTHNIREVPLFPLHVELFPGRIVPLQIFEARYLDMIREVAGQQEGFGVVLIQEGQDVGPTPDIVKEGTLANIIDFSHLENGLLGITIQGSRTFTVEESWVKENGLMMARVRVSEADST